MSVVGLCIDTSIVSQAATAAALRRDWLRIDMIGAAERVVAYRPPSVLSLRTDSLFRSAYTYIQ